ncbi:MAG: 2,6-beta-D-fructofuranosidase [Bacteroidaceae bacterium]|nr:2,6-beta-D-fructofuranosidase [Bacteroidaceae bacterium]
MNLTRVLATTLLSITAFMGAMAQDALTDSTKNTSGDSNRNVLMNASSATQPRQISLGLPISGYAYIFEDGLPVSYYNYQVYPYKSWHNGVSHESVRTMGPQDMVLKYGVITYSVDSWSKLAGDQLEGKLNYSVNHHGRHTIDANISTPLGKGWGISVGTYHNFDPGSNHLDMTKLQESAHFYKAALSKSWNEGRGKAGLIYQYSQFREVNENYGPFIFVGDGSVKEYDGFRLGIDQYRPANRTIKYLDVETGKMVEQDINDANTSKIHHVNFVMDYLWDNDLKLSIHSKFKHGQSLRSSTTLMGVSDAVSGSGYTYEDGNNYLGKVQTRRMLHFDGLEHSWMTNAALTGKSKDQRHNWRAEVDYWLNHGGVSTSMYLFAHEAKKDPKLLLLNGNESFSYNSYAEYYDGHEHKIFGLVSDEWNVNRRLWLYGGVRLEYLNVRGLAANDMNTGNARHIGFSLADGGVVKNHFSDNHFNYAFIGSVRYALLRGFGLQAEYSSAVTHSQLFHYGTYHYPTQKGMTTNYFRGGIFWKNQWIDLTSQITYISMSNSQERPNLSHVLTKDVGDLKAGMSESFTQNYFYDIATLGWLTDAVITPVKGLSVHLMFTIRDPRYKNYKITPTFSDGVTETYDFTDKTITALSKTELEIEPSYRFSKWRVWLSARYFSKQYINKTNSLYFNGRWETFGGVDFQLNKHINFAASVVNILNQKGASGTIPAADLITDPSLYKNYVMAGTFIRPFTFEFTTKLKL